MHDSCELAPRFVEVEVGLGMQEARGDAAALGRSAKEVERDLSRAAVRSKGRVREANLRQRSEGSVGRRPLRERMRVDAVVDARDDAVRGQRVARVACGPWASASPSLSSGRGKFFESR